MYSAIFKDFYTELFIFAIINLSWPRSFLFWRPFLTLPVPPNGCLDRCERIETLTYEHYDFHQYSLCQGSAVLSAVMMGNVDGCQMG